MISLYSIDEDNTIELPKELVWTDEFNWTAVKANKYFSITGDLIIENYHTTKGRLITLSGENAVLQRINLLTLFEWTNIINHHLVLTLHDDRSFNVMFRAWDYPIIEVSNPVNGYAKPQDDNYYKLTLKLAVE